MKKKNPQRKQESALEKTFKFLESFQKFSLEPLALIVFWFGLSATIWAIPFPEISFMGRFNGFFNWFTLFMAGVIYYYLKLAPTLSYAMLLSFGVFSFLIVQLEYLEQDGGLPMVSVALLCLVVGLAVEFIGFRKKNPSAGLKIFQQRLFIGPLWYWSKVFEKLSVPF